MAGMVEVRCPSDLRRLFLKLHPLRLRVDADSNLMEVACGDCAREYRRNGEPCLRVLHRYNFVGEHVETVLVDRGGAERVVHP